VKQWGAGVSASSDAMTIDATRRLWNARVDPKRRRHGVALYTHVLDQWGIVYDQQIVVTQRQAGVAIEGVVRQDRDTATRIERLAVDTHGYTDFGMAMARVLGFDLCPRLKSLRDRKLHVPCGIAIPDSLRTVVRTDVSLRNVEVGWDELLRVCASVDSGDISAVLALERFGSDARADPAFKAG
jgi:TnpA family transposase